MIDDCRVIACDCQATAFREGVCEVVPPYLLGLLDAVELKRTWGGFELDEDQLCTLREHTFVGREAAALAKLLWLWLEAIEPSRRADLLLFATGSARLPDTATTGGGYLLQLDVADDATALRPTAENGLSEPTLLARSATCFRTLYLPRTWETVEQLRQGMEVTLTYGGGYGNC